MLGPAMAAAWLFTRLRTQTARGIYGIVIAAFAILSMAQAASWRDSGALFAHTMAINPDSYLSYNNLGSAYVHLGNLAERASEIADRIGERRDAASFLQQARAEFARAAELFEKAAEIKPNYTHAHANLGIVYQRLGQRDRALVHLHRAYEIQRDLPAEFRGDLGESANRIGQALLGMSRIDEADQYFDFVLKTQPTHEGAVEGKKRIAAIRLHQMTAPLTDLDSSPVTDW
jgi:tetratricopeptide (TPR) repeat protein